MATLLQEHLSFINDEKLIRPSRTVSCFTHWPVQMSGGEATSKAWRPVALSERSVLGSGYLRLHCFKTYRFQCKIWVIWKCAAISCWLASGQLHVIHLLSELVSQANEIVACLQGIWNSLCRVPRWVSSQEHTGPNLLDFSTALCSWGCGAASCLSAELGQVNKKNPTHSRILQLAWP